MTIRAGVPIPTGENTQTMDAAKESMDEDDKMIRLALERLEEARKTPWVIEALEARARSDEEDRTLLAEAFENGEKAVEGRESHSPTLESDLRDAAAAYAKQVMDSWKERNPRRTFHPPKEVMASAERLKWWKFDRDKAERDRTSWEFRFTENLADHYLQGALGC